MPVEINQQSNYYKLMNYSFEYIDIILLAMIAGFIFLRLRGILGKRTGFEGKSPAQFKEVLKNIKVEQAVKPKEKFDDDFFKLIGDILYHVIVVQTPDTEEMNESDNRENDTIESSV